MGVNATEKIKWQEKHNHCIWQLNSTFHQKVSAEWWQKMDITEEWEMRQRSESTEGKLLRTLFGSASGGEWRQVGILVCCLFVWGPVLCFRMRTGSTFMDKWKVASREGGKMLHKISLQTIFKDQQSSLKQIEANKEGCVDWNRRCGTNLTCFSMCFLETPFPGTPDRPRLQSKTLQARWSLFLWQSSLLMN